MVSREGGGRLNTQCVAWAVAQVEVGEKRHVGAVNDAHRLAVQREGFGNALEACLTEREVLEDGRVVFVVALLGTSSETAFHSVDQPVTA